MISHLCRTTAFFSVSVFAIMPAFAQSDQAPAPSASASAASDAAPPIPSATPTGGDIIVTGTRMTGLRASDSPAPIQILGNDVLKRVGQTDLVQALAQTLPSVQAQAFGADQAAMHPSIKLRGLNPNHTLILINGKRRHGTANVVISGGPYNGNAAPDIALIPEDAIDHIEVLQDGAAAQYGTDAIAGVINIILKKKDTGGSLNATGGQYMDGGGKTWDVSGNIGIAPFENAYLNVTAERKFHDFSFRGDLDPRFVDTGVTGGANTGRTVLALFPNVANLPDYPYLTRVAGDARYQLTTATYDAGYKISPSVDLYTFGSYSHRNYTANENYRAPNVIVGKSPTDIPFPLGFLPQQATIETDYAATLGVKGEVMDTTWDLSSTYGKDLDKIYLYNSANASLYYDTSTATSNGYTPRNFHDGDFVASQWTNNLDLTHKFDVGLSEPITVAGGLEYRRETYDLRAGDPASYYVGTGTKQGGVQSFFGFSPANASSNSRDDVSEYLDVSVKPLDRLLLDGAVRHEHYSDFGSTTVEKLTGRFDFSRDFAVRGTASTGFRAPTLAEEYYSGTNVAVSSIAGVFAPNSAGAKALGISGLKPEKSTSFSAGIVAHPASRLTLTVDAYSIKIRNRIVQSGNLYGYSSAASTITSPSVLEALRTSGVPIDPVIANINAGQSGNVYVNTFVNGASTLTRGVDAVATYSSNFGGFGHVDWSLAVNYNDAKITKINAPPSNVNQKVLLLDKAAQSMLVDSTPKIRVTAGAFWTLDKFSVNLRESFYGKAFAYQSDPINGSLYDKIIVKSSFITDLELSYQVGKPLRFSIGANNLLNTYPTKYPAAFRRSQYLVSSVNYVTKYPQFSPIGINGGYYYARVSVNW